MIKEGDCGSLHYATPDFMSRAIIPLKPKEGLRGTQHLLPMGKNYGGAFPVGL
jgi:hypothetical protein